MDSGYYAAYIGLLSRTQSLDTIANNLANVNTVGYRAQKDIFSSVLTATQGSPLDQAINEYGVLGGTKVDLSQGALQTTGNDLDLAIEGSGFFAVNTANGAMYTRDGSFQVSAKGQLVTQTGDAVMGVAGPINIPPGQVSISSDGTISSAEALVGRLKIVQFVPGARISSAGRNYYTAVASEVKQAGNVTIRQGALEDSNVNPVSGMVELITAQRTAEIMQHALSTFDSEFNKTAAQDLPRIS